MKNKKFQRNSEVSFDLFDWDIFTFVNCEVVRGSSLHLVLMLIYLNLDN